MKNWVQGYAIRGLTLKHELFFIFLHLISLFYFLGVALNSLKRYPLNLNSSFRRTELWKGLKKFNILFVLIYY